MVKSIMCGLDVFHLPLRHLSPFAPCHVENPGEVHQYRWHRCLLCPQGPAGPGPENSGAGWLGQGPGFPVFFADLRVTQFLFCQ